ncbi:Methylcrotonoyl-CoA carboxylase subunit alpha, mitochondrial [Gamsiella multidivaricata]|nr:Methylcrotonoyl-CoA carboxylase subunit alpha, mitochondrial [Gamsiella multidivaricata]
MEMNTRLQVEHPITDMTTYTDLTELDEDGWAFEASIYAENSNNNLLFDVGVLIHVQMPEPSKSVRLESGFMQGDEISALNEYEVVGLDTNIEFLKTLASHPEFITGKVETGFIKEYESDMLKSAPSLHPATVTHASLSIVLTDPEASRQAALVVTDGASSFTFNSGVRLNQISEQTRVFKLESQNVQVGVELNYDQIYNLAGENAVLAQIESRLYKTNVIQADDQVHASAEKGKMTLDVPQPKFLAVGKEEKAVSLRTPMPCKIPQVMCKPGDRVGKSQALVVLEAMKMEVTYSRGFLLA